MELYSVSVTYILGSPPRRGALAVCAKGRMAIITGKIERWNSKTDQVDVIWRGIPFGLGGACNEKYKIWQSKDPVVIGYLNIEDLS